MTEQILNLSSSCWIFFVEKSLFLCFCTQPDLPSNLQDNSCYRSCNTICCFVLLLSARLPSDPNNSFKHSVFLTLKERHPPWMKCISMGATIAHIWVECATHLWPVKYWLTRILDVINVINFVFSGRTNVVSWSHAALGTNSPLPLTLAEPLTYIYWLTSCCAAFLPCFFNTSLVNGACWC